ncbi:MAG: hypothetical protein ACFCUR_05900 [Rhodomicrobiaceae bacterium]
MMGRLFYACAVLAAVICAAAGTAIAQQPSAQPQQQTQQAAPNLPAVPDPYTLNMMIRSSVIALNQANKTGNYSVLLDLGAPAFRASNNSASLAQIFAALRQRNLDLSPILFFTPKLVQQPEITPNGILRLAGFFPTAPERVNFDIYMQMVGTEWQLFGIGVSTSPADVTSATPQADDSAASAGAKPAPANQPVAANPGAEKPRQERAAASPAANAPPPERRPSLAPAEPETPAASASAKPESAVQNGTTSNAVRIDLSRPPAQEAIDAAEAGQTAEDAKEEGGSDFWGSFNPFARN